MFGQKKKKKKKRKKEKKWSRRQLRRQIGDARFYSVSSHNRDPRLSPFALIAPRSTDNDRIATNGATVALLRGKLKDTWEASVVGDLFEFPKLKEYDDVLKNLVLFADNNN